MALVRDFEVSGSGFTVPDAYHVIVNVKTEKRLADIPPPPDSSRENGLTDMDLGSEVYWKAGYVGKISIQIFASKEARDNGLNPVGWLGDSPTDAGINGQLATPGLAHEVKFMIDPDSSDSILTQAYNHLKTTEYYKDAQEV